MTEAFEALEAAGYHVGSAYTAVKDPSVATFVYRDSLWEGADLVGLGVASFGHVNGVHLQNVDTWESIAAIEAGGPAARPCLSAEHGRAPHSRVHPPVEARLGQAGVLTRSRSIRSIASAHSWTRSSRRAFWPS